MAGLVGCSHSTVAHGAGTLRAHGGRRMAQSNKAVETDAQVRPRALRASILVRRSPLRYTSAGIALRA
jgi:hypothetical protein